MVALSFPMPAIKPTRITLRLPRRPLLTFCLGLFAAVATGLAQTNTEVVRAFYIGHSLTSDIPGMTRALANSDGRIRFSFRHQDIPGAPLRWQWEEKERKSEFEPQFGGRYHLHLPQGDFNVVVLTDSVPRGGPELEAETIDYLGRFVDFARQHQPDVRIFYYETWPHLTSGTPRRSEYDTASPSRHLQWRPRLDADKVMWERIVREVNRKHPGSRPVRIIPSGQVLASIYDAINAGKIPGWTKIDSLFSDEIHLNNYGKYIVALSHYTAITGRSPIGLGMDIKDVWGGDYWDRKWWDGNTYPRPKPETVRAVQEIVARMIPSSQGP